MNQIEGLLILIALPTGLLLTGYWLAALLERENPLERLAFALPCGLGLLLAAVAAINFFHPLAGAWAYACLSPALLTLIFPRGRTGLGRDLLAVWRAAPRPVLLAAVFFFVLLLWPVLLTPASLFYDGTSNHDSFFWIAGAEHLKRHTYMELPVISATQPLTNQASALIGWQPAWGRMGTEGLLALASSAAGVSPLKLYLYATASLAVVWFAMVYLALRTFVTEKPAVVTGAVLVSLQPIFVFFYGNANLPNLLGALTGAATIIAVERAMRAEVGASVEFTAWAALAALSLHGLLCSYPEMGPFVLLPCGLLWLRPWFTRGRRGFWRTGCLTAIVLLAGLALNPATTIRAVYGFLASFSIARADTNWANLFNPLDAAEFFPALVTLSVSGAKELDWWFGGALSALILGVFGLVVWRSRDRYGLFAGLAGSLALAGYTLVTHFAYGWQKTVQFSGIFFALAFPAAAIDVLWGLRRGPVRTPRLATAALGGLGIFLAYATVMNCRDIYKWSDRKVISADWFALRDVSRASLHEAPVLVEAATFRMAFFHGMWAAYFLSDSQIYYGARGEESGGYLRSGVVNEQNQEIPSPAAVLVGHDWADAFDANSPRLYTGREFALLQKGNRVFKLAGVFPLNGVPDHVSGAATMEILPHSTSNLLLELAPRTKAGWPAGAWRVTRRTEGAEDFSATVTGASPWRLVIPLVAGRRNEVTLTLAGISGPPGNVSFLIRSLRIEDSP
jgi:hypothetical protein